MPPRPPKRPDPRCADCDCIKEWHRKITDLGESEYIEHRTFGRCRDCGRCRKYKSPTRRNKRSTNKQAKDSERGVGHRAMAASAKFVYKRHAGPGEIDGLLSIVGSSVAFLANENKQRERMTISELIGAIDQAASHARTVPGNPTVCATFSSKPGRGGGKARHIVAFDQDALFALLAELYESIP